MIVSLSITMVNYPNYCCSSSHQLRWVRRCKRSGRLISARPVACSTARTAMEHAQQMFLTFAISSHIKIRPEVIYTDILVGGLEHFLFFHISGMSSSYHPNWFSYFQRGWQHQPEAIIYIYDYRLTKLVISRISRVNPLGWADCRVN